MLEATQTIKSEGSPLPLVSICIPSFNNADFIAATLQSVLDQTFGDFEVVITDDHSADDTVSVISTFTDRRIRLIRNEANLGMGANWNKAVLLATGRYIKLLCGDDLLYPDCLLRQVRALEDPANSKVTLAVCGSLVINPANEVVLRRRPRSSAGRVPGPTLVRKCVRWGTNLIGEPAVGLFRRDILAKSGLFDPSNPYLIDLAFWAQLLKLGDAFVDPTHQAGFRLSASSVSAKAGLNQAAYFRRFVHKIYTDPSWRITKPDAMMGTILSFQWCILRNLLINLHARKGSRALPLNHRPPDYSNRT